jgi:hypothetical protein
MAKDKNKPGHMNTGHMNTGNWNTGNWNTGHWNTGSLNTGNWNTGHWNTGHWNTGHWNTGYFCEKDGPVIFFDKPCDRSRVEVDEILAKLPGLDMLHLGVEWVASEHMSEAEKLQFPAHTVIGGFYRTHTLPYNQSMPLMWEKLTPEQRKKWTELPNFDAEKFLRMYGIDTRETTAKTVRIRLASGEIVTGEIVE